MAGVRHNSLYKLNGHKQNTKSEYGVRKTQGLSGIADDAAAKPPPGGGILVYCRVMINIVALTKIKRYANIDTPSNNR